MVVLVVLLMSLLIFRSLGVLDVETLSNWPSATRNALAAMLVLFDVLRCPKCKIHITPKEDDGTRLMLEYTKAYLKGERDVPWA
jgi:uncharacterized membrane protein